MKPSTTQTTTLKQNGTQGTLSIQQNMEIPRTHVNVLFHRHDAGHLTFDSRQKQTQPKPEKIAHLFIKSWWSLIAAQRYINKTGKCIVL